MSSDNANQLPVHDRAALLSTGDELVLGQLLDTNNRLIAQRLVERGIRPVRFATVPDDLEVLAAEIARLAKEAPLVIMSGGLGPTDGDLTRLAIARNLGEELITDAAQLEHLRAMLAKRGRQMTDRQARQAQRPPSARALPNAFGTAPGLHARLTVDARHASSDVFCLPGPPGELRPMLERFVEPSLRPPPGLTLLTRLLHVVGAPEADTATKLGELTRRDRQPLVGMTASGGILTIRVRYEGPASAPDAMAMLDADERAIRAALGDHVFAIGPTAGPVEGLAAAVGALLRARGVRVRVSEVGTLSAGALGQHLMLAMPEVLAEAVMGPEPGATSAAGCDGDRRSEMVSIRIAPDAAIGEISGSPSSAGAKPSAARGMVEIAGGGLGRTRRVFAIPGQAADVRPRLAASALGVLYFGLVRGGLAATPPLLWEVARQDAAV